MQCGTWTKHAEGGVFTSPNYPSKYPPDRECIYIIEGEEHMDSVHGHITEIGFGAPAREYLSVDQITKIWN